jgi:hypothetical protein
MDKEDLYGEMAFYEFGCFVVVRDGVILTCPMMADGSHASEGWGDMTAPESQEFLDEINLGFGTDFRFDQFSGR